MNVKVAPDVVQRHEFRQAAFERGLNLSAILAQFRLDERQASSAENLLFAATADPLLSAKNAILIDLEALELAQPCARRCCALSSR